jgi:hypothetical protein
MYNRYSGVFSFVIAHDNPQYGCALYTVTGYCQAICCRQIDLRESDLSPELSNHSKIDFSPASVIN